MGTAGKVSGLECIQTELGKPDESGRRRPVPVEGSEFIIACDAVIGAIGQQIDTSWAAEGEAPALTRRGTVKVNYQTMQTSIPHVFAAGDAVTGPASVIEAADYVVDFGPGAGALGGRVVGEGTPKQLKRIKTSLTGRYLSGKEAVAVPKQRRRGTGKFWSHRRSPNGCGCPGYHYRLLFIRAQILVFLWLLDGRRTGADRGTEVSRRL